MAGIVCMASTAATAARSIMPGHAPLAALPGHAPLAALPGHAPLAEGQLPPFTAASVFGRMSLDPLLTAVLLLVAGAYLYGVWRLRSRGIAWPALRTVLFLVPGLGGIALVTLTGIGTYDDTLLSVHMIQHMVLGMISPIFLALGAPVTLALRVLPVRPRRVLVTVLHSRVARVLAFPLVAYAIFVANPFVLYFTGLYRQTLEHAWLHEWVHVHFVLTGCLFFWPLIGLDPLPGRWPYPARALLMVLSTPFHAVLGLTIMQSKELIGGSWYTDLGLTWADPKADQVLSGGILWAGGEIVSVTMIAVLVVQWMRQAEREARRIDRLLDRQEAEEAARELAEDAARERAGRAGREPVEEAAREPASAEAIARAEAEAGQGSG